MRKLSIIIPVYNEEKRIEKTLLEYFDFFDHVSKNEDFQFEIITVLNACKDNSRGVIERFRRNNLVILDFEKGGKGFAVIEGFKEGLRRGGDLIGFVDADMSTLPEDFYDLVKKIKGVDGTIASRYIKGSMVSPKNTFLRTLASRVYNSAIRSILLIPYRDTQCGAKLFTRKALSNVLDDIGMTQWAFDIELIYKIRKGGFSIREVPTKWSNRGDYSKINFWVAGPWMTLGVIRLRILNSPFKKYVLLYDHIFGKLHKIMSKGQIVK